MQSQAGRAAANLVGVSIGSLDDPSAHAPDMHISTGSALAWANPSPDVRQCKGWPADHQ